MWRRRLCVYDIALCKPENFDHQHGVQLFSQEAEFPSNRQEFPYIIVALSQDPVRGSFFFIGNPE